MIRFTVIPKKKPFGTWQFRQIGVLVNFSFFLREQENIFRIYSGPKWLIGKISEIESNPDPG